VEDAEGRMVVVCDPEPNKNYLDEVQLRSKERRYTFDVVLGKESTNKQVFETTTQHLAEGVVQVRVSCVWLAPSVHTVHSSLFLPRSASDGLGQLSELLSTNRERDTYIYPSRAAQCFWRCMYIPDSSVLLERRAGVDGDGIRIRCDGIGQDAYHAGHTARPRADDARH
jgi:hypothetical protein